MTLLMKPVQAGALAAALLLSPVAFAQKADSSPAKKELVARILKLQQPAIEQMTLSVLSTPVNQLGQRAMIALRNNVPEDKRESAATAVEGSLRKFVEDNGPPLVDKGVKLAPSTMGVALDEKFTEDELRQLITWLESPVNKKFAEVAPQLQQSFTAKLIENNGKQLDEKFNALQATVGKQLGLEPQSGASAPKAAAPKGPVNPAKK